MLPGSLFMGVDIDKWFDVKRWIDEKFNGDFDLFCRYMEHETAAIEELTGKNRILTSQLKRIRKIVGNEALIDVNIITPS
jgi:hypothetical protein